MKYYESITSDIKIHLANNQKHFLQGIQISHTCLELK